MFSDTCTCSYRIYPGTCYRQFSAYIDLYLFLCKHCSIDNVLIMTPNACVYRWNGTHVQLYMYGKINVSNLCYIHSCFILLAYSRMYYMYLSLTCTCTLLLSPVFFLHRHRQLKNVANCPPSSRGTCTFTQHCIVTASCACLRSLYTCISI